MQAGRDGESNAPNKHKPGRLTLYHSKTLLPVPKIHICTGTAILGDRRP